MNRPPKLLYVSLPSADRQRTRSDERHLQLVDYRLDSRGIAVRFPTGAGDVFLPQHTFRLWGLPNLVGVYRCPLRQI